MFCRLLWKTRDYCGKRRSKKSARKSSSEFFLSAPDLRIVSCASANRAHELPRNAPWSVLEL